ncbi:MAG: hypothetical protein N2Z74_08880, partial [Syntrophales bacterium]|nr:hypothetical protein [Syntrophales bacterium]
MKNMKTIPPGDLKDLFGLNAGDTVTVVDYVYGYDSVDHDNDGNKTENRTDLAPVTMSDPFTVSSGGGGGPANQITIPYSILGAAVHTKPLALYYDNANSEDNLRIFYGANDGLLHCFTGRENSGPSELWAYMPAVVRPEMQFILSGLDALVFNSTIDGPLTLFHLDTNKDGVVNNGEKAYLIIAYRRGIGINSGYTVIDISAKNGPPQFVQHLSIDGQSWSRPAIFVKGGTYYIAFGGGYDPCFDADTPSCETPTRGARIHIYPWTGTQFNTTAGKVFTVADSPWLVAAIAAEAVPVNTNGRLLSDTGGDTQMLYFVDVTGTVFRVYHDGTNWAIRVVMRMRDNPTPFNFGDGIKTYYSFLESPYYDQFMKIQVDGNGNGSLGDPEDVFLVPVPLVTGNIVYPNESSFSYEIVVTYDIFPNGGSLPPALNNAARYPTKFLNMTAKDPTHSFFEGSPSPANLRRGYFI